MKYQEIKQLPAEQRYKMLLAKQAELGELRSKLRQGQLKEVRQVRQARLEIAQLLTLAQATPAANPNSDQVINV